MAHSGAGLTRGPTLGTISATAPGTVASCPGATSGERDMESRRAHLVASGCLFACLLTAAPRDARGQACGGLLGIEATQVGQDVHIDVSVDSLGSSLSVMVERPDGEGTVQARAEDEGDCSLTMPEPATGCGCWGVSVTVVDECVPPGTHEYTVYEECCDPVEQSEMGTVEITVTDSGDPCLPEEDDGEEDGGCSVVAARGARAPALVALLAAAAVLARARARRSPRRSCEIGR
jgi:hypothetical protein